MTIIGTTNSATVIVQSLSGMRERLDDLQRQLGTGEKSNTYAGLGPQRGLVVGLQSQLDAAQGFDDTITKVATRMSLSQASLSQIFDSVQNVRHAVVQPVYILGQSGQTIDQGTALGQLDIILGALNTQDGTGYIFSGLSPDLRSVETLDHILNGYGTQAGFKQIISERRQADLGADGLGRLIIPAAGTSPAAIGGTGATLLPDAVAAMAGTTDISSLVSAGGTLVINGVNITINPGDNAFQIQQDINAQQGATGVSAALNGAGQLVLTGVDADTAISIGGATTPSLLAELGLTVSTATPTNLLTQGAVSAGETLQITVGANPTLTITFGNGPGQVSTMGELATALQGLIGGTATIDQSNGNITILASNIPDTITVGGTANAANFGLTTLAAAPSVGTRVSVSEDVVGSPFGFKLAGVTSTLSGATVSGPTGAPSSIYVDFQSNPNPGENATITFTLPDGTTENLTLNATATSPPGTNQFLIGATPAATAANFQSTLTAAIAKLADVSLVSASAVAASNDFFNIDASNPPLRVNGPPFDTATSLIAGTSTDTVFWYTGEAGSTPARSTANARIDSSITISFGMRANEQALCAAVRNVAVFAAMSFSPANPNGSAQYSALTLRLATNFAPVQGVQAIPDIEQEIANSQVMSNDAQEHHKQSSLALTDFLQSIENVTNEQVGAELLAMQTRLQASLQTTSMLSKLSLIYYL